MNGCGPRENTLLLWMTLMDLHFGLVPKKLCSMCIPGSGIIDVFSSFQKLTYAFQVNIILIRVRYIIDFSESLDPKCLTGMRLTCIEKELLTSNC